MLPTVIVLATGHPRHLLAADAATAAPGAAAPVQAIGGTIVQAIRSQLPVLVLTTPDMASAVAHWVARKDVLVLPGEREVFGDGVPHGAAQARWASTGNTPWPVAAAVAARAQAGGWLLLPGDLPDVQPGSLRAVAQALAHHPVVVAQHQGLRGHPLGIATELYSDLVRLRARDGVSRLAARYPALGLELPDPGVLPARPGAGPAASRGVAALTM